MEYAYVNGPMIRSLRTDLGLSQEDLARVAGVKLNTISRMEVHPEHDPKTSTVAKVANALGVKD